MKNYFLLFVLSCTSIIHAQIDSMEINGEYHFIYPFKQDVQIMDEYYALIKDDSFFEDYHNYFKEFEGTFGFSIKEFETLKGDALKKLNKRLKDKWRVYRKPRFINGPGRRFIRKIRKNPEELMYVNYTMDREVIPPFEAIPDGKYVMLFEDFCMVDEKGHCQPQQNRVAAHFNIKSNALDGYTVWLNVKGDTIKQGQFVNGLKEGTWKFVPIEKPGTYGSLSQWAVKQYVMQGYFYVDTSYYTIDFKQGAYDGNYEAIGISKYGPFGSEDIKGHYTSGQPVGDWEIRSHYKKTLLMKMTFADPNNKEVSHSPILRYQEIVRYGRFNDDTLFNFSAREYDIMDAPVNLFELNFQNEDELQLSDELFKSLDLEHAYTGNYIRRNSYPKRFRDRENFSSISAYLDLISDPKTEKVESRGYFIDSVGVKYKYDGFYEVYYPNGALFTRYEFKDGDLVSEGDLLWDNGQVYDHIEFVPDSNHYRRLIYDYDGRLYKEIVYDKYGDIEYLVEEKMIEEEYFINGYKVKKKNVHLGFPIKNEMLDEYQFYDESLEDSILTEPTIISKRWQVFKDTSVVYERIVDPIENTYTYTFNSYDGTPYMYGKYNFAEDYSSFTGSSKYVIGNFTVERTFSGALKEFENDTMGMRHMHNAFSDYTVATDEHIYLNGELYSGDFSFIKGKKFKLSKKELLIKQGGFDATKKFRKDVYRYMHGKKIKHKDLFQFSDLFRAKDITYNMFLYFLSSEVYDQFHYYDPYSDGIFGEYELRKNIAHLDKIEGHIVAGKAEGLWTAKMSNGKIMKSINFHDGLATGKMQEYMLHSKSSKKAVERSEVPIPRKETYFLSREANYENGKPEGTMTEYYWDGSLKQTGTYHEGKKDGVFEEFHPLAYSKTEFNNGLLDGYMRTYLTLPEKDTVMIYELNFQHGELNGESKAFHTNGKLANQCFFLDSEPIEDYIAYDTLGFRYHYVKFQYGFPVEEKIWEENQLSLRYQFNWEDSILFRISEITNTMSLQSLVYKMGYDRNILNREYYGRRRLINKNDLVYHMTKYYPNDTVARDGRVDDGSKVGHWDFYDYYGEHLYSVEYFDTILRFNDSIAFISKGIYTDLDSSGNELFKAHIIEKREKYDCAHTDHYEIRQFYTIWERDAQVGRMNGYVKNYYDNGVLQGEGEMKNGLPTGLWRYYDPFGKLNLMGNYVMGKRDGRWLSGDLSKKKYLGEICLNPELPDLEKEIEYRENLLDIEIQNYKLGKLIDVQYYDLNLNSYQTGSTSKMFVDEIRSDIILR